MLLRLGRNLAVVNHFSKWGRNSVILENMKKGKKREGKDKGRGRKGKEKKREGEEKGRGRKGKGKKREGEEKGRGRKGRKGRREDRMQKGRGNIHNPY